MAVPEAAVDKDDLVKRGKDKIRLAREFSDIFPELKASLADDSANNNFGICVCGPNPPHILTSLCLGQRVQQILLNS